MKKYASWRKCLSLVLRNETCQPEQGISMVGYPLFKLQFAYNINSAYLEKQVSRVRFYFTIRTFKLLRAKLIENQVIRKNFIKQ